VGTVSGGESGDLARARHIGVALSGGGHRASLFGLGALLYLVDAGKGPELATISSISGGSITNGYAGMATDVGSADPGDFWTAMQPFSRQVASMGTLFASPLTVAYLATGVAVVAAAVVATVVLTAAAAWLVWAVALLALGWLAQQRSWVAARAFDRTLFQRARLDAMHGGVAHVICAADLQTAEHVYFSDQFVNCFRAGWGVPGDLRLAQAVQASAALPGAFNVVTLPVAPHHFEKTPPFRSFKLTDGGVYDNMGTEWPMRLAQRLREGTAPAGLAPIDELVVVNGSAAQGVVKRESLRAPLLGELTTLLAVKDVLYDQTTAVRRRLLDLRFRVTRRDPEAREGRLAGALVQIDRSPYDVPDEFAAFDDELADRARDVIARLGGDDDDSRKAWRATADASRSVKTALSKIPADRAASLVRHAYVLTMANCHVLLGYPIVAVPDDARFRELVS
jgi:predicted acylesterase/phospholipase RssA